MSTRQGVWVAAALGAVIAAFWWQRRKKEVVRAAIDVGSAEHKLVVGVVRPGTGQVLRVLHSETIGVALGEDFRRSGGDGSLSPWALEASSSALTRLAQTAKQLGARRTEGVATAVFRRASNGELHIAGAAKRLGVSLTIVTQRLEGELGYATAVAAYGRANAGRVVSWDSGGGSFQLSDGQHVFEGPLGNADVQRILGDLSGSTGNPVQSGVAMNLVDVVASRVPEVPLWLRQAIAKRRVCAFGARTSLFRLAADLVGSPDYSRSQVLEALETISGRDDDDLNSFLSQRSNDVAHLVAPHEASFDLEWPYPELHLLVPKLVLLAAVMTKLGVENIHYEFANGSCLGILVHPTLWQ